MVVPDRYTYFTACLTSCLVAAMLAGAPCALGGQALARVIDPGTPGAAAGARRAIAAARTDAAITIDGRLDEAAWLGASPATSFVQTRPSPGAAASERTEARVLYAGDALYVGMRMHDADPAGIAATLGRRDYDGYSDWAQVIVDSYRDRRTAFRFAVNPRGVKKDAFHFDDRNEDLGWDAVWDAATSVDSAGWTAELRIPLSQLRYSATGSDAAEHAWGINFIRDIARREERSSWAVLPPDGAGFVSRFGDLTGLRGLPAPRRLEVIPYTLGRLTSEPGAAGNPFRRRGDLEATLGADVRYGVTPDLTLTATVNPDFGQVEADPSEVNLTGAETFLTEKRPFFLEGADIFRFDIAFPFSLRGDAFWNDQAFYTRRVGRPPQGDVPDADHEDIPLETTILAAAKLSGKTAGGWSVGLMDAVGAEERGRYADEGGPIASAPVEPLTNYAVARVKRDFRGGRSAVGGIATATNRRLEGELARRLRDAAYTAGADARHRFGRGDEYEARGAVLGSYVSGSAAAMARLQRASTHYFNRPDAPHVEYDTTRGEMAGMAANVAVEKNGGAWRWGVHGATISPGFDMNDQGFQRGSDWLLEGAWVGRVEFKPGRLYRNWELFLNQRSGWSYAGERRGTALHLWHSFQLRNYWGGYLEGDHELPALTTTRLRGGPATRMNARSTFWAGLNTDRRRPLGVQLNISGWREQGTGGHGGYVAPGLFLRPSSRMDLSLSASVGRNGDAWQFVDSTNVDGATRWLTARIDQTTTSLTTRLAYTFTRDLSLQVYLSPFLSAGRYTELKELRDARARSFSDRWRVFPEAAVARDPARDELHVDADGDGTGDFSIEDPDFDVQELRANTVLRWEYRPGSTLFLVWSQGRDREGDDGRFDVTRHSRRLLRDPATDVLLLKVSHWLGR